MILQHLFRFGLFFCFLVVHSAKAETLTLFNWEDFLAPEIIEKWETETGHELKQVYYDNEENRDSVIVSNIEQKIDVAIIDNTASRYFGSREILVPLEQYETPSFLSNIEQKWQASCGDYSVPYLWGTLGLAYRKDKVSPPSSWYDLLNPSPELAGHVGLIEDYTDLLAPALIVNNRPVSTSSKAELQMAFEMMKKVLPSVLTFTYGITFLDSDPKAEELHMSLAYSGDQHTMNSKSGTDLWEYTTLKEGTVIWLDCMAVLATSPRKDLGKHFIQFINRPEIAALNSDVLFVATANKAAKQIQSKEVLSDQSVYPPPEILKKAEFYDEIGQDNLLLRNRITSSLVKIHESQ